MTHPVDRKAPQNSPQNLPTLPPPAGAVVQANQLQLIPLRAERRSKWSGEANTGFGLCSTSFARSGLRFSVRDLNFT